MHLKRNTNLLTIVTLLLCVSCETKEDVWLSVDNDLLEFPSEGGVQNLRIESDTDWKVVPTSNIITVSTKEGTKNAVISVKVPKIVNDLDILEEILIVKTAGGEKTLNVKIRQEGLLRDGDYMAIPNRPELIFDGDAYSEDSINVQSNLDWTVKGPDWIEVRREDGKWVPLSRSISGKGVTKLHLRTASANGVSDGLEDSIRIIQTYEGNITETIRVKQTGKFRVGVKNFTPTVNSFAFAYSFGLGISEVRMKFSDRELSEKEYVASQIKTWDIYEKSQLQITSISNLKEDCAYYLYTAVYDGNGMWKLNRFTLRTKSSENQPIASISSVQYNENEWKWNVVKSKDTYSYYCISYTYSESPQVFLWNDAMIIYSIHQYVFKTKFYKNNRVFTLPTEDDICVVTRSVDYKGSYSSILSKYIGRGHNTRVTTNQMVATKNYSISLIPYSEVQSFVNNIKVSNN